MPTIKTPQTTRQLPNDCLIRSIVLPKTVNEADRTIQATIASEKPVTVYDWQRGAYIDEVLLMSGCELPANNQLPLLDNHDRFSGISAVKGSARDLTIDPASGMLNGTIHFSSTAEDAWTLAREGDLTDLSAGYQIYAVDSVIIPSGESAAINGRTFSNSSTRDMVIRKRWKIYEASITPVGADDTTKMRSDSTFPTNEREASMPDENKIPATDPGTPAERSAVIPPAPTVDTAALQRAAQDAEIARSTEITTSCRELGLPDELVRQLIDGKKPIAECRQQIINKAKESFQVVRGGADGIVTGDEKDRKRKGMIDGLCLRAGYPLDDKIVADVNKSQYRNMSLQTLARACLIDAGVRGVDMMDNIGVADAIIDHSRRAYAQGTSDFPHVLAATSNKFMQYGYTNASTTYRRFAQPGTFSDFKINNLLNLTPFSDVEVMQEGSAFSYGKMGETQETAQLMVFGKAYSIPWQAIVNDDKGVFSLIPQKMGYSVDKKINRITYELIFSNGKTGPIMKQDSKPLFHAEHNNIAVPAAPGIGSLGSLRAKMHRMKAPSDDKASSSTYVDAKLSQIICSTELETVFQQLWKAENAPMQEAKGYTASAPNPFQGQFEIITDPLVDELGSSTTWFGLSRYIDAQHIGVFTLDNYPVPTIRTDSARVGESLGVVMDVSFAATVAAVDYRGIIYNAGA